MRTLVYFCKNSWWDDRKARKVLLPLAFAGLEDCRTVLVNAPPAAWRLENRPLAWHHPDAAMNVLTPVRRLPGQRLRPIRYLNQRSRWSMVSSCFRQDGNTVVVLSDPEDEYIACIARRAGYPCWFDWTERWDLYQKSFSTDMKMPVYRMDILNKVDGVIAVSRELEKEAARRVEAVFHLPNAVSDEFLARLREPESIAKPAEYARIPEPRAVHIGSYNPAWIDWPALVAAAGRLPQVSFCMIGGGSDQSVPTKLPSNVFLLGRRPYEELPSYLAHADLCLLLYRPSATSAGDPTKLYEYLAAGRPIASTPHPRAMEMRQWLHIGSSPEEYAEAAFMALNACDRARADAVRAFAAGHTWSRRAALLRDTLFEQDRNENE